MQSTPQEFMVASSDGNSSLRSIVVVPQGEPKALVQISHGMAEHIERYWEFMEFLSENGYLVCGHDHLGHGRSTTEENRGFFGGKGGVDFLVEDIHRVGQETLVSFGDLPHILFGHSMGSFLARLAVEKYSDDYTAAIFSGTAGKNPAAAIGIPLAKLTRKMRGERYISPFLVKMSTGSYGKQIEGELRTLNDWLSRDPAIVDAYETDPDCGFPFTTSGMIDLMTCLRRCNRKDWFLHYPKELPTYFFAGTNDPVGNYGKGVSAVYHRLREVGVTNVTLRLYPGGRHEMLNEINHQEVYDDLLKWLNQTLKQ